MIPAQLRLAAALALALSLVGAGGASLAQPSTAVARHSSYVTLVELYGEPEDERVITGTVPCTLSLQQRIAKTLTGRDPCTYEDYAYAYPAGARAPWEGTLEWVNDSYYVDETGSVWHVAEVVYRAAREAPEGGDVLVRAIAGELLPSQASLGGLDVNYALPIDLTKLTSPEQTLIVGIGPAPSAQ